MKFFPQVLNSRQKSILRLTAPSIEEMHFHLGGGTSLALQLGHRHSVDFDWFTGERITDALLLAQSLRDKGIRFTPTQIDKGTLHGQISQVRFSFLEYRYPLIGETVTWPEYGCSLLSLDDIACMKLAAIAQRGSRKDFIDLYALGRSRPLGQLLSLYRKKYGIEDIGHVLVALAYFDDADRERGSKMLWQVSWRDVKKQIRSWLEGLTR